MMTATTMTRALSFRRAAYSVVTGAAFALALAGCNTDRLTSLNTNPNSPEDVPPGPLFTRAVVGIPTAGSPVLSGGAVSRWLGPTSLGQLELVAQHLAKTQYPDEDRYARIQAGDTQNAFNGAYSGDLQDLRQVVRKGRAAHAAGIYGPALVMQTYDFANLTDAWGDVPYSQALAGDSTAANFTPAYDRQQEIYAGLLGTLNQAVVDMNSATGATLGSSDPIYGGNIDRWMKLANSLHARLALRLVNVDPATANAELTKAFTAPGGVFTSLADQAQLGWPGDGIYDNPWAVRFKTRDDYRMSRTLMDIIVPANDPRVPIFAMPTVDDPAKYAGMPNGLSQDEAGAYFNTASRPGAIFYPGATLAGTFGGNGGKQPSYIMTYAEVLFIEAEAAERSLGGLNPAQARDFYEAAIAASMQQWGVTDAAAIASYIAQPAIAYQGGTPGLKQIAVQKWIALYTDGLQAWSEWRRTCQPNTIAPGPAAVVNFVPRRLYYPTTELSTNADNVAKAIAAQGADDFGTRIYWDKKPTAAPTCG